MSLQLAIYPQNKNGYNFTATPDNTEHVADNILFTTLPLDVSHQSIASDIADDALNSDVATGNWKRFNSGNGGGWVYNAYPTLFGMTKTQYGSPTSNGVVFKSNSATGNVSSGIYQKIYNLIPLQSYDLVIEISSQFASSGFFVLGVDGRYDCLGQDFTTFSSDAGTFTHTFEAQSNEETLVITYNPSTTNNVSIESVSIKQSLSNPNYTYSDLYDGQQLIDLKDFTSIPLTLSVDEFKNATEKTQSYTKDFTLPATKNNNNIFYNLFDVTVSVKDKVNTFNPLMQTKCKLSEDGIVIFEGFLKLTDIQFVDGQHEYNVHLYSDIVSIASTLKDRLFKDLDFTELEHDYNSDSIEKSWTGVLPLVNSLSPNSLAYDGLDLNTTPVLKYPLIDWTGNLDDTNGSIDLINLEQVYRPFIQCKYLVDKIFEGTGFRYSSDFMQLDKFTKLFMDFNYGEDVGSSISVDESFTQTWLGDSTHYATQSFTNLKFPVSNIPNAAGFYDTSTRKFTATTNNQSVEYNFGVQLHNDDYVSFRNVETRVLHTKTAGGTEVYDLVKTKLNADNLITIGTEYLYFFNTIEMNSGDTLEFQFKCFTSQTDVKQLEVGQFLFLAGFNRLTFKVGSIGVNAKSLLDTARGELNQWDFMKGLFNMFNLVALPDPDDSKSFIIEPYNDIFVYNSDSKTHDWTKKENIGQHTLTPLELVKTSHFTYIEDKDDYPLSVYSDSIPSLDDKTYLYGALEYDASGLSILRGEQSTDSVIFAPTLLKPLTPTGNSLILPAIYKSKESGVENGAFANVPRILYDCGITTGGIPISSPLQNSSTHKFNNKYSYLQFTHFSDFPTNAGTLDLNWGVCQMAYGGFGSVRNLFNEYWSAYYDELHHVDTKVIKTELMLDAHDISSFKFYDRILLKNREYRINKIDYKPNSISTVELILIP